MATTPSAEEIKQKLVIALGLLQNGRYEDSKPHFEQVLAVDPNNTAAHYFYGICLHETGLCAKAIPHLQEALKRKPGWPDALYALAAANQACGYTDDALEAINQVIAQQSDHAGAHNLKSLILCDLGEFAEGLGHAETALDLSGGSPSTYVNKGVCLHHLELYADAIEAFEKAISLSPDYALAYKNLANTTLEWGRRNNWPSECYDTFLTHADKALSLLPDDIGVWQNKALITGHTLGIWEDALPAYEKALSLDPDQPELHSDYLMGLHYVSGKTQEELYKAHRDWETRHCVDITPAPQSEFENDRAPDRRLRIGMVSALFCRGPVGFMTYQALSKLPQDAYELYMYADMPPERHDEYAEKYTEIAAKWTDIRGRNSDDIYDLIRGDKIDIMLDLVGHSENGTHLRLFARRLAPIQVEWVGGLFNTSGLEQMDWIIGDAVEIPEAHEAFYTETVYRMPDDYICYEPPESAHDVNPLPAIENGYVTFGNLNNLTKLSDGFIASSAAILNEVPDSRLLLKTKKLDVERVKTRLLRKYKEQGIERDRLILEGGATHQAFLETYNRIDIALDPHPYSGGLTTCEALWMGVPVLTLPGPSFAGRHAASHLTAAGLPDWIAENKEDLMDKATTRAADTAALADLRSRLRDQVKNSALVDSDKFAEELDKAFRHMWQMWVNTPA